MICSSVNRDRLMSASFRRTLPKSGGNLGAQVTANLAKTGSSREPQQLPPIGRDETKDQAYETHFLHKKLQISARRGMCVKALTQ